MLSLEKQNVLREAYRRTNPNWRPSTEVYAVIARSHLNPDDFVLDLGCGRGGLIEQLAHPLNQTVGIDPDLVSLREHRLPLPRAQACGGALPFVAESFDMVLASWLLEHVPHPGRVFREVGRILKPGGIFVFITPNKRHPLALLNRVLGRVEHIQGWLVNHLYGREAVDAFSTFYRANTSVDLERLAAGSDLLLVTLQAISDPTYLAFTPGLFRLAQWLENRLPSQRHLHLVGYLQKP